MSARLKVESKGQVLFIGLNRREKYNAIDVELYLALADPYGDLQRDDELRCGLLYGEGKHFCAGVELDKWGPHFANGSFPELHPGACDPFGLDPVHRVAKPMVVAARGICFTAALELMLAADVRVAADDARFGQIEVKRGIYAVGGATIRFVQNIGWGSGRIEARTGLRMMPTFPRSALLAGRRVFPGTARRLAYQAGLSQHVDQFKPAPGIR